MNLSSFEKEVLATSYLLMGDSSAGVKKTLLVEHLLEGAFKVSTMKPLAGLTLFGFSMGAYSWSNERGERGLNLKTDRTYMKKNRKFKKQLKEAFTNLYLKQLVYFNHAYSPTWCFYFTIPGKKVAKECYEELESRRKYESSNS